MRTYHIATAPWTHAQSAYKYRYMYSMALVVLGCDQICLEGLTRAVFSQLRNRNSRVSQGWGLVAMSPNLATKTGQLEILATKRSNSGDNTRTQTLGSASRPRSLSLVSHPGISRARGTPCTRLARVIVNTYAWRDKLVSRPSLPLRMST